MSDRFDTLFDSLRGQQPPEAFVPTDTIRRRGRQRARRQATLAGVAVLAVAGISAGAVATAVGGPSPHLPVGGPASETPHPPAVTGTPTPTPPAPAPTEAPDGWLLTAADLGPGQWQTGGWEPEWTEGPDRWLWEGTCPGYRSEDYPSLRERYDQTEVTWTDGPYDPADVPRWFHQIVDVFASGPAAARHLDDIRTVLELCDGSTEPWPTSYVVVGSGFAGDESMLVRERVEPDGGPVEAYTAVVRVGAAVATVRGYDPALGHADPDDLRHLTQRVAERMR
jgi:hypothetical protein